MITLLIRTLIIYTALIAIMRFMGKRQLGELEISDLVTTLLVSEIASLPLTNTDVPLSHALLPILVLTSLEVLLSGALLKIPLLKNVFAIRPAILIRHGIPDRRVMRSVRVSSEELLSQLRQKDITDPSEVAYAILEPNGQISIIKKAEAQPPTLSQLDMKVTEGGMMHMIICDGKINEKNLSLAGKDERWLEAFLLTKRLRVDDVFLLLVDDSGTTRLYPKEEVRS
jgi:uncharacterized membrane protein YcaP (DUF421 family)